MKNKNDMPEVIYVCPTIGGVKFSGGREKFFDSDVKYIRADTRPVPSEVEENKFMRSQLDKFCDYAVLNEAAQDRLYPNIREETIDFLYPKQALAKIEGE